MGHFAYYAISRGEKPGIYSCWFHCQHLVSGYSNAKFRKFFCHADAQHFLQRQGLHDNYFDVGSIWPQDNINSGHRYYAVSKGYTPGIYTSLGDCNDQLRGYSKCEFRKFFCRQDAKKFLNRRKIFHFCDQSENEIPHGSKILKNKKSFLYDPHGFIQVWVDGACINNGKFGAAAGIGVWFDHDHHLNVSKPIYGNKATNIVAETQAVIEALLIAKNENMPGIIIYTDSHYIIDCVDNFMEKWKRNGFINFKGRKVANEQLLRKFDFHRENIFHQLVFVRAHSGNEGNEEADKLAKLGAQKYLMGYRNSF